MSDLSTKLAEALAFKDREANHHDVEWGRKRAHSELAPLHKLLVEAVGALENIQYCGRDSHRLGCPDNCPAVVANEALQALRTQLSKEGV